MTAYFLDTSIIIDYLKGDKNTVHLLNTLKGDLVSSYFCLAELYEGVFRATDKEKHEETITVFFGGLTKVYGLDAKTVKVFGELRASLKKKGQVIEDIDLFIASTCLRHDMTLITRNKKHFERVENLLIYS